MHFFAFTRYPVRKDMSKSVYTKTLIAAGLALAIVFSLPVTTHATDGDLIRAEVVEVLSEEQTFIPGFEAVQHLQQLRAKTDAGTFIEIENDRTPLEVGDMFFANVLETADGTLYTVQEPDRREALLISVALFAIVSIIIGGFTGLRALISLGVSFIVIIYFLLPALSSGVSPVIVSVGFAAIILALAMGITHGLNRTTFAAFLGSIVTIIVAVLLGEFFVTFAHLTGFADDTTTILNLTTGGALNMQGILLGALIVGILGIIDDLTITQVSTVEELHDVNPELSKRELYTRAMRVGKQHFGAVVNTLFLAYAGAAMPLLMLFTLSPSSPWFLVNSEIIAIEIVRAAVGGVALALALPIATLLGVLALRFPGPRAKVHTHH